MNKKLPNVYHNNENITTNNKDIFISYQEVKKIIKDKEPKKIIKNEEVNKNINFFKYFNKQVKVTLSNNEVIYTKILSKKDNKVLLSNGTYLNIEEIKSIN